jgi:hypothetical protein
MDRWVTVTSNAITHPSGLCNEAWEQNAIAGCRISLLKLSSHDS